MTELAEATAQAICCSDHAQIDSLAACCALKCCGGNSHAGRWNNSQAVRSSSHAARCVTGIPRLCSSDTALASRRSSSQASVGMSYAARCMNRVPCRCTNGGDASAQGFSSNGNNGTCGSNGLAATVVPWMLATGNQTFTCFMLAIGFFPPPRDLVNLHS